MPEAYAWTGVIQNGLPWVGKRESFHRQPKTQSPEGCIGGWFDVNVSQQEKRVQAIQVACRLPQDGVSSCSHGSWILKARHHASEGTPPDNLIQVAGGLGMSGLVGPPCSYAARPSWGYLNSFIRSREWFGAKPLGIHCNDELNMGTRTKIDDPSLGLLLSIWSAKRVEFSKVFSVEWNSGSGPSRTVNFLLAPPRLARCNRVHISSCRNCRVGMWEA